MYADVLNSVCYSAYGGGLITVDQGYLKAISLSPTMLNKGHTILDPEGPVWVDNSSPVVQRRTQG